jgi:hypothetical protein
MLRTGVWTLARLVVVGLLVVGYAHFWGLSVGWPPFTPKWMWNQSGEWVYPLTVAGQADAIKVVVRGYLNQGSLRFELRRGSRIIGRGSYQAGPIEREFRYLVASGEYTLVIFTEKTTGRVLYDAVGTRYEKFQ